ncbi:unnamed protein product [Gongylonema pulchrum]|uniref:MFS domain-containing protein n=1 Tax=Gongylonema pulchrum TaxID=637853 RepID=A0A183CXC2_9BILA|nr:unnamed protein product [Gongylonema pulchrum]
MGRRVYVVSGEREAYLQQLHENPRISFRDRTRYVILTISIICLAWLMGNSLILNFTIICMREEVSTGNDSAANATTRSEQQGGGARYPYSNKQIGLLFSAIAIGSLIGTYPVVLLETRLSRRNLLTLFGLISAVSTLLIPTAASIGFWLLFAMRFLEVLSAT